MLGLDISSSSVKLLELSSLNGKIQLETYGIASLPDQTVVERKIQEPKQVGETIRLMVERIKPSTRNAITAVSGSSVITRKIEISASLSLSEIEAQVIIEADQFIPFPIDEVAIDFEILGPSLKNLSSAADNANNLEVLLVACRLETVNHLQNTLEYAGLTPKVVDVENYAIERAVSLLQPYLNIEVTTPLMAIVDIGANVTNFSVLHKNEIIYSRDQLFGGQRLTDEIMQYFNMPHQAAVMEKKKGKLPPDVLHPFQEATLQQINRALQLFYSSTTYRHIDYILLTGGSSLTTGLASEIQARLKIPTSIANPFQPISINSRINKEILKHDAPALMAAFGLAMRIRDNASN